MQNSLFSLFYRNLFLTGRLFGALACSALLFMTSFFLPWLNIVPYLIFFVTMALLLLDLALLYSGRNRLFAKRHMPERLSNGDENEISIYLESRYGLWLNLEIIDEIPQQFQKRDLVFRTKLKARGDTLINYTLRPTRRGEYTFNLLRVFVSSPLGLIQRRYSFGEPVSVAVYPSFLMMRKYELMAISNRLSEVGIKKIRRLGTSMEFEQLKNYTPGDDYRSINWKATARQGNLMVNTYSDEKAQNVYCIIDKSRNMKSAFEGLSLLDYAINTSLILSSVALLKEDKAGLITVSDTAGACIAADRRSGQLNRIMEALYKEKSRYLETNFELLYNITRKTLKQRSLVVFFGNFESMHSLERQLPFLKKIAKFHLLVVVFFENTELKKLSGEKAANVEEIYIKTIAEKLVYEKKLIAKELARHGIQTILTAPQNVTVNTINRYLQIKSSQKL
ncbi:MAG: DUF58 domain-containing protein [Arcticibacter sp.]